MNWKVATVVASLAALGAAGYAYHLRRTMRKGWVPLPPAPPAAKGGVGVDSDTNSLAAAQFKKGSKAIAEGSKKQQLGDVRAHDRDASKEGPKGG